MKKNCSIKTGFNFLNIYCSLIFLGFLLPSSLEAQQVTRYIAKRLVVNGQNSKVPIAMEGLKAQKLNGQWELIKIKEYDPQSTLSAYYEWVEPDALHYSLGIPGDPRLDRQWSLYNQGQLGAKPGVDIGMTKVWGTYPQGRPVTVGLIDSGVDWKHPDLTGAIWQNLGEDVDGDGAVLVFDNGEWVFDPDDENGIDDDGNGYVDDFIGWDFVNDDNNPMDDHIFGHGTHIAGTIAAKGGNGIGISGINWSAKIMALKFLDSQGTGYTSGAIMALEYAAQMGAELTNNSWGGGPYSQALLESIASANIPFIAAAGNNYGNNNDKNPLYPASYQLDQVISILATDHQDELAQFSNIGSESVDLGAPGYGIYSTLPEKGYGYLNGTSMAAGHVAGVASIVLSREQALDPVALKNELTSSLKFLPGLLGTCQGSGRLNAYKTLQKTALFWKGVDLDADAQDHFLMQDENGETLVGSNLQDGFMVATIAGDSGFSQVFRAPRDLRIRSGLALLNGGKKVAGYAGGADRDFFLAHLSNETQGTWGQVWGNPHSNDELVKILAYLDGYLLIGTSTSLQNGTPQLYLAHANPKGVLEWEEYIDLQGFSYQDIGDVIIDEEGQLFICGTIVDEGEKAFVLKAGIRGKVEWAKTFSIPSYAETTGKALAWYTKLEGGIRKKDFVLAGSVKSGDSTNLFEVKFTDDGIFKDLEVHLVEPTGEKIKGVSSGNSAYSLYFQTEINGSTGILSIPGGRGKFTDPVFYTGDLEALILNDAMAAGDGGKTVLAGLQDAGMLNIFKTDLGGNVPCQQRSIDFGELKNIPFVLGNVLALASSTEHVPRGIVLTMEQSPIVSGEICGVDTCTISSAISSPVVKTCEDGIVLFGNLSRNSPFFEWRANGEVVGKSLSLEYEFKEPGIVEIGLLAFDDVGCSDYSSIFVQVEPKPELYSFDTTICASSFLLDAKLEGANYTWYDDDENVLGREKTLRVANTGKYELEVIDTCGNEDKATFEVQLTGDCVWPGDVNADGKVDLDDFLLLGLAHGTLGAARANPSTDFSPFEQDNWETSFPATNPLAAGVNHKHADTNGDGVIDIFSDKTVIAQNINSRPGNSIVENDGLTRIGISSVQRALALDDTIRFAVTLSTLDSSLIRDIYGLRFRLDYNLPLVKAPVISSKGSWLGEQGELAELQFPSLEGQFMEVGITRFDKVQVNGTGSVAFGGIIIAIEDIGDVFSAAEQAFFTLSIGNAQMVQNDGTIIPIGTSASQGSLTLPINISKVEIEAKVFLQGAYDPVSRKMRTSLAEKGFLPQRQPFDLTVPARIHKLSPRIVDWMVLELRDKKDIDQVLGAEPVVLLEDGTIVDPSTYMNPILDLPKDEYHIAFRHRNHLPVISKNAFQVPSTGKITIDFGKIGSHEVLGTNLIDIGGVWGMVAGDINQDGRIQYSGKGNDRRLILKKILDGPGIQGYFPEDINQDGQVDYSGSHSDRAFLLRILGGQDPTRVINSEGE